MAFLQGSHNHTKVFFAARKTKTSAFFEIVNLILKATCKKRKEPKKTKNPEKCGFFPNPETLTPQILFYLPLEIVFWTDVVRKLC
jgi:hypothetical protein